MTHSLPRRGSAIVATVTALAAGPLVPAISTAGAAAQPPAFVTQALLGDLLGLLDNVLTMTTAELQAALAPLSPAEIGDLLAAADAAQLAALLGALDLTQLSGALGTLDAVELDSVVDGLDAGQTGDLLTVADATQLTALLGVLTADQLTGALATLDAAELTTLLGTLTDMLASAPPGTDTSVLEDLIREIGAVLETVGVVPPETTTSPAATPPAATAPPGAAKPAPATKPSIFDLIPKVGQHTAKLGLARASILTSDRKIDVLAPITSRASGRVKVDLYAAGRHHRFTAPVDSANGRIRFKQSIPRSQARLGTGIMTIDYAGNDATRPQSVRLRAASRPARLSLGRPTLSGDGRLKASGTISRKARGIVRMEVQYVFLGETKTLKLRAKIAGGEWKLDEKLSDAVLVEMMLRTGSVHSYTLFTGYFPERMRGEMRSYQILGDRT